MTGEKKSAPFLGQKIMLLFLLKSFIDETPILIKYFILKQREAGGCYSVTQS